ncbi:putative leucine-rich repeat-containing, plant-type, leucine-rich repeat domain superfamily [Helianthus anomalus]
MFKQNLSTINNTLYTYDYMCEDWIGSGYNPMMKNRNTSTNCCDWNGVTCDHSAGDVIGLDLSCGMVQGTIHPNSTLFHLPRLQRLNLAYNNFTDSQLPPDIVRLSNSLTHLNITNCGFIGQVPIYISHLHKLVSLDLSFNEINLQPHVFINLLQNLTAMKELSLTFVNISIVLPSNLNISSSSLNFLNLGSTGLHGNLPPNFFSLQSLENLDLSGKSLTRHIPSDISLPKLVELDLSLNENLLIQPCFSVFF